MQISDRFDDGFTMTVHALIVQQVTSRYTKCMLNFSNEWPHLRNLITLAEYPEYMRSHLIDMLVGSDVYGDLLYIYI